MEFFYEKKGGLPEVESSSIQFSTDPVNTKDSGTRLYQAGADKQLLSVDHCLNMFQRFGKRGFDRKCFVQVMTSHKLFLKSCSTNHSEFKVL